MFDRKKIKKALDLFLISFIALYFEILLIRWIPSSVQIVAYFTNIILISSFLGLGIGCFLSEKKPLAMNPFPFLTFTTVTLLMGLNRLNVRADFIRNEHLLGFYSTKGINFLVIVTGIFIFNTLIFIPLGQKLGACLKNFKPLISYSINIFGSICGIVFFSYLSYLMTEPVVWFFWG